MPASYYDPKITAKKCLLAGLATALLPAIMVWLSTASIPATPEEWKAQWPFLAAGLAGALIRGVQNWWKHAAHGFPSLVFAGILAAVMLSACQSTVRTSFSERIDADGAMDTQYTAVSRGDVDRTLHTYAGEYGPETTRVAVGQDLAGLTSPAHMETAAALSAILPAIIEGVLSARTSTVTTTGTDTPMLDRIERIEALVERFRHLLE
jgi:hypothetical protein